MDHRRRYRSLSVVRPAPQAGVYMARARVGRTDGSPTSDYASNMHMMRREHGRPTVRPPGRGARVHVQQTLVEKGSKPAETIYFYRRIRLSTDCVISSGGFLRKPPLKIVEIHDL
jgi:hypothetical protein